MDQSSGDRPVKSAPAARQKFPGLRVMAVTAAVLILIFGGYEIIERLWLIAERPGLIHFLHILRGIGAAIMIAFLLWRYILRAPPALFPSRAAQEAVSLEELIGGGDEIAHFGRWFIRMRWIACLVTTLLALGTTRALPYLEEGAFVPLMFMVLCLAMSNVVYALFLRWGWFSRAILALQIYVDLVILTAMLHFSGGIENPMIFVYIFHIIIGGILLSRRKCYAIALAAASLFAAMALAEMGRLVHHKTLLIFPHPELHPPTAQSHLGPEEHKAGREAGLFHVAHEPLYVSSVIGLQFVFFALTAYFTTSVVARLRAEENRAKTDGQRLARVLSERQRLEKEVLEISNREQQRIGQDLHDGLCQQLGGIAFMTQALERKLKTKLLAEAADAARITQLLSQGVATARNLAKGLSPVKPQADGLMAALRELASLTQDLFGIACVFRPERPVLVHDNATAIHLYRIAQEALNNAVKHAQATEVLIELSSAESETILTVKDNGRGLPEVLDRPQGMGLNIMNYRAHMIGAALDVRRDSPGGTIVRCSLRHT